jgi:hypothetical protein
MSEPESTNPYDALPPLVRADIFILQGRVESLEIQVKALMSVNTLLTGIMRQAQEMYQPASPPMPKMESFLRPESPAERTIILAEPHDDWFPVWHVRQEGEPLTGCGDPAYYVVRKISLGEKFDPSIMRVQGSDGFWRPPDVTEVPRCSACHLPIDPRSPVELDFSYARTLPPTAPEQRTRKPRVNTRRSRPAQEVRVGQPPARPGGGSSPGPSDLPPESTLPAPFTPEARSEVVHDLNQLAREMGLHG